MGCMCYCECKKKKRERFTLNILILILSSLCIVLNSVALGISKLVDEHYNIIFEIIMIVINSIVSGLQTFQLKIEKLHPSHNTQLEVDPGKINAI